MTFIFCRVVGMNGRCDHQSWAVGSPFSSVFYCPIHGLVDSKGKSVTCEECKNQETNELKLDCKSCHYKSQGEKR